MTKMAAHPALATNDTDLDVTVSSAHAHTPSLLQRISTWYMAKVHAERDAEIVAFIEDRGGQFNDAMEREISRRFGSTAG
jgi:hypothetical protein